MNIKTLEGVDKKDLLSAFNDSFSDYFIPFQLSEEQFTSKIKADKTDLSVSVGVFEDGNLVAFILHGFDVIDNEKTVYNGGTGVVPQKRGAGLTKQMYQYILPRLKEKEISRIVLEVITKNIQAIRSYEKSGFKTLRTLLCYKGEVSIEHTNKNVTVETFHDYDWEVLESFWDIHPTWQNSKHVIDELQNSNISLGAYLDKRLIGYLIYNPVNNRVQQISVHPDFRQRKVASTLVDEIIKSHGNALSIINADESSKGLKFFFEKIGLENHLDQYEMELQLI